MKAQHVLGAALVAIALLRSYAAPELVGVMRRADGNFAALRASPSKPAQWVHLGETFAGYVVENLDETTERLTLRNATESIELALPNARVGSDPLQVGLPALAVYSNEVRSNLQTLAHAALQYFWESDVKQTTTTELTGPERPLFKVEAALGENYTDLRFKLSEGAKVTILDSLGNLLFTEVHSPRSITIMAGSSLESVAQRFGLSLPELQTLNPSFQRLTAQQVRLR